MNLTFYALLMVKGESQPSNIPYYGQLTQILELRYTDGNRVVLFHGEWYDVAREGVGYNIDRYGVITVNTKKKLNTQEPFVLASQVSQVYYIKGLKDPNWATVIETKPRNFFDVPEGEAEAHVDDDEPFQEESSQRSRVHLPKISEEDD
jgi:hypothetical protein